MKMNHYLMQIVGEVYRHKLTKYCKINNLNVDLGVFFPHVRKETCYGSKMAPNLTFIFTCNVSQFVKLNFRMLETDFVVVLHVSNPGSVHPLVVKISSFI